MEKNPAKMSSKPVSTHEIPDIIVDSTTGKRYDKGKFLGKVRNR